MKTLILFEFKKFFSKKKNIIGIFVLIVFVAIYAGISLNLEKQYISSEKIIASEGIRQTQQLLDGNKDDPKREQVLKNDIRLDQKKIDAINNKDWKSLLNAKIEADEENLQLQESGIYQGGEDVEIIKQRIALNKLLLKKNIQPIYTSVSVSPYNFVILFFKQIFPLGVIILIFLFSADFVSSEIDDDTYKLLLIQPLKKEKIIIGKLISCFIICVAIVAAVLSLAFLVLGLIKGFGSPDYPILIKNNSSAFLGEVYNGFTFISVGKLILLIIPLIILVIAAICSIGILFSTIFNNGISSITAAMIIAIVLFTLVNQMKMLNGIINFLPSGYYDVSGLIDGTAAENYKNASLTYFGGYAIMFIYLIISTALSLIIYKKKSYAAK